MGIELSVLLGMVCALGGFVVSYIALRRNQNKDCEDEGKSAGQMLSELGYIKANTEDIKSEQREQRKINTELYSRVSTVESSTVQAHKRIDGVEERLK